MRTIYQMCPVPLLGRLEMELFFLTGVGDTFGEIALVHRDSFRNATIIADEDADLMVIDQELFDRSLSVGHGATLHGITSMQNFLELIQNCYILVTIK